ncbi:MAG: hypothetical protein K9M11_04880 [Candidatus Pacebacteria bacterium]|nr:hypothetical protein [Candidatus Paceibacterota bacterium]
MSKQILIIICGLLLITNFFLFYKYTATSNLLANIQVENKSKADESQKFSVFLKLLVAKVLQTGGDVSFEDRLTLENSVRNLNDTEILSTWKNFVDSKDNDMAQKYLKNLLQLLVNRINP